MKGIIGAVVGDIAGSLLESFNSNGKKVDPDFEFIRPESVPTDDTVCTCAVANWLMKDPDSKDVLIDSLHEYCLEGRGGGFGGMFAEWLKKKKRTPYNSFGNGSAMRVSPVGWFANDINECMKYAKISAEVTHNHPEGIIGAQAVACAVFLTRNGYDKEYIREFIEKTFNYDLHSMTIEEQMPTYHFYVNCAWSVPQSIQCWLESSTYEETVRKAILMNGDTDTMGAIAGSIAASTPGMEVPDEIINKALNVCWPENAVQLIDTINEFNERFIYKNE